VDGFSGGRSGREQVNAGGLAKSSDVFGVDASAGESRVSLRADRFREGLDGLPGGFCDERDDPRGERAGVATLEREQEICQIPLYVHHQHRNSLSEHLFDQHEVQAGLARTGHS
jgi:hypothetical protein